MRNILRLKVEQSVVAVAATTSGCLDGRQVNRGEEI